MRLALHNNVYFLIIRKFYFVYIFFLVWNTLLGRIISREVNINEHNNKCYTHIDILVLLLHNVQA